MNLIMLIWVYTKESDGLKRIGSKGENKMNKLQKAIIEGKTLKFGDIESRYYKLQNNVVMYSDNLKDWKKSNSTIEMFKSESVFSIVK